MEETGVLGRLLPGPRSLRTVVDLARATVETEPLRRLAVAQVDVLLHDRHVLEKPPAGDPHGGALLRVPAIALANLDDDVHARDDRRHPDVDDAVHAGVVEHVPSDRRPRIGAESRNFSRKARLGLVTVVALG